ncbi:MAG: hypothetical protein HYW48_00250 [Deltaproteobacteria bacterium]|nr:hypothetical protein [Deltaproteobacteria bacterium]
MVRLHEYRRKRNIKGSKEPDKGLSSQEKGLHFVIHRHQSARPHFDLRLEWKGVLKSWAVPKGPSLVPGEARLAIMVEDHPLDYGNFEGVIPQGHYGAGTLQVWDCGIYMELSSSGQNSREQFEKGLNKGHLKFHLDGQKVKGAFSLVRTKENQWLLIKKRDKYSTFKAHEFDDRSALSHRTMEDITREGEVQEANRLREKRKKLTRVKRPRKRAPPKEPWVKHPMPAPKVFKETSSRETCVIENGPTLSKLSKIMWPDEKLSKGDLLDYYKKVGTMLVPYIRDRLLSLNRFPNGIHNQGFYQKNITGYHPKFLQTETVASHSSGRSISYPLCQNEESLLYLVNQGCVEMHAWLSKRHSLQFPDLCVIDIDPPDETRMPDVVEIALYFYEVLRRLDWEAYPKTSGGRGMHIYIPIMPSATFDEVREFLAVLFSNAETEFPDLISLEQNPDKRRGKIYLDALRNSYGKTMASVYSVRPRLGAPVSCPLRWDELRPSLRPETFHLRNILKRLEKVGDLWHELLFQAFDLKKAMRRLKT